MDQNLKRSIILEHYQNPKNKGLFDDNQYYKANMNNESCIDEINLMAKIEDGKVIDIHFDGEACAICTSATSIMIETLTGKNISEVKNIIENYKRMIEEQEYNKEILEQAIVYDDIHLQPNRKKCALLSWWGMEKIINEIENKK